MCGIVGIISRNGTIDRALLDRQRDALIHRGPDSCGSWFSEDGKVALGHRRLAIIDLSPAGHQPMLHAASDCVITFNGEIYNFAALRDELRTRGHSFETQSDTEVILGAYREWGVDCVERLSGMFAFALYDPRRQVVFFARDRAGEKPLFYSVTPNGQLVFASEIKAMLLHPDVSRTASRSSLNEYLTYGYVTGSDTMLRDVRRVPPGSLGVYDIGSGELNLRRYWNLPAPAGDLARRRVSAAEANSLVDELHLLLKTAVGRQLVADVPVGVLLSGGVDSSIISAIAAEVSPSKIRTFTARFPGHEGFDEGPYARLVARHIGSDHTELEAAPATPDLLQQLAAQYDDPIADSSMIPTYLVSREIRKHATVALGGDGGDELFGGYLRHPVHVRQARFRRLLPKLVRQGIALAAGRAARPGVRGRGFLIALGGDDGTSISQAGRIFRSDERASLSSAIRSLSPAELVAPEAARALLMSDRAGTLQRSTAADFSSYMVDDVLVKVDRASMLTSLEVRAPFLDPSVIEFAFSKVPDVLRATSRDRKIILRMLGARLLPPALDLKRKQGFSIPVDSWFRGAWGELLRNEENHASVLVDNEAITAYRKRLQAGESVGDRLFALLLLRFWERAYSISDIS